MALPYDPESLHDRFARPGSLTFMASELGGTVARLEIGDASVVVALQGAHVLDWRVGGADMLWRSPVARLGTGKAVRGGIPICWPWFGPHPVDVAKPAHGFVRTRPWEVVGSDATQTDVSLVLEYVVGETDRLVWPHRARVRLTVTLGDGLSLALATTNNGAEPFALTQALHTYFAVGDITAAQVEGLDGRTYMDKTVGYARSVQAGPVTVSGEVDRIYLGDTSNLTLKDGRRGRQVHIASTGSRSAVVWNPWAARTAELGDMGSADAYERMICIETANAGDDVVALGPGETHTLGATYRVGRI